MEIIWLDHPSFRSVDDLLRSSFYSNGFVATVMTCAVNTVIRILHYCNAYNIRLWRMLAIKYSQQVRDLIRFLFTAMALRLP